jgi:hypothetical protein
MLNLTTIPGGFIMRDLEYITDGIFEILHETQAHISTNNGTIFIDTTVTINNISYKTINELIIVLLSK